MTRNILALLLATGSCVKDNNFSFCRTRDTIVYREKSGEILEFKYSDANSIIFSSNNYNGSTIIHPYEKSGRSFNFLGRFIIQLDSISAFDKNGLRCYRNRISNKRDKISCILNESSQYILEYSKGIGIESI